MVILWGNKETTFLLSYNYNYNPTSNIIFFCFLFWCETFSHKSVDLISDIAALNTISGFKSTDLKYKKIFRTKMRNKRKLYC